MTHAPTDFDRMFRGAAELHQSGNYAEAEKLYAKVLKRFPTHFHALNLLAMLYLQTGRPGRCVELEQRAIKVNPSDATVYANLGKALLALKRFAAAILMFDKALALNDSLMDIHFQRGEALLSLERDEEALACFKIVAERDPLFFGVHNNYGYALNRLKRYDEAIAEFDRGLSMWPDTPEIHNNRGFAHKSLNQFDKAILDYDKALARDPGHVLAHHNKGTTLEAILDFDGALASYETAIAVRPDYYESFFSKGLLLLKTGDFKGGWVLYEDRKRVAKPSGCRTFSQPLWTGSKSLTGRVIFVHSEQGLGDTIQFCRYAPLLRGLGAKVVMSVQAPLLRLFRDSMPDIEFLPDGKIPASFDFHTPLLSLPRAFGTEMETIPSAPRYLAAAPGPRNAWNARLQPRPRRRIGLVWSGNPDHRNDYNRTIGLRDLQPLLSFDAEWICLHKAITARDAELMDEWGGMERFDAEIDDFADTAALIDNLDLVISVDTSVAHLAGALGKPVWILLPFDPDWRWLMDRSDSPWYPSARLFRQPATDCWPDVVGRVKSELSNFFGEM